MFYDSILNIKKKINILQKGFTLVELLIVIAIIGVLAALLMSNFIGVRQRARDAQRKSDLKQVQSALELYRSDVGTYPSCTSSASCNFPSCGSSLPASGATIYMQKIPCDPSSSYNSGSYAYWSDSSSYYIAACSENASDSQAIAYSSVPTSVKDVDTSDTSCTSGYYYLVNQP